MNESKITRAQHVECISKFFILNNRESELQEHLELIGPLLNDMELNWPEHVKQKMMDCFSETTNFKEALANFALYLGAVNVAWTDDENLTLLF